MTDVAICDQCAKRIEHGPAGELGGIVVDVVRRLDFYDLHAAQAFGSGCMNHLKSLARQ